LQILILLKHGKRERLSNWHMNVAVLQKEIHWCFVLELTVRTLVVVRPKPCIRHCPDLPQVVKQLAAQHLLSEGTVEPLNLSVAEWFALGDEVDPDRMCFGPFGHILGNEFWPVVSLR
jgi:hypothetical protein